MPVGGERPRELTGKAVERMKDAFLCRSADILAAMGPCIGPCCYEVDGPVKNSFYRTGFPVGLRLPSREGGKMVSWIYIWPILFFSKLQGCEKKTSNSETLYLLPGEILFILTGMPIRPEGGS